MSVEEFISKWKAKDAVVDQWWDWNNNEGAGEFWTDFFREVYDVDFWNDDRITVRQWKAGETRVDRRWWLFTKTYVQEIDRFEFEVGRLSVAMDYRRAWRGCPRSDSDLSCSFGMLILRRKNDRRIIMLSYLDRNLDIFDKELLPTT